MAIKYPTLCYLKGGEIAILETCGDFNFFFNSKVTVSQEASDRKQNRCIPTKGVFLAPMLGFYSLRIRQNLHLQCKEKIRLTVA